jgi:hypothetical protein
MTPTQNAWLTLDMVARRYCVLPSYLLKYGSSVDFYCAENAIGYESWVRKKKENGETIRHHKETDTQKLQSMAEQARKMTEERRKNASKKNEK